MEWVAISFSNACTDRAEPGEVLVNTGIEPKGQLGLCRVQAGAAPALGWELGGQDVAAGVGVPETPRSPTPAPASLSSVLRIHPDDAQPALFWSGWQSRG